MFIVAYGGYSTLWWSGFDIFGQVGEDPSWWTSSQYSRTESSLNRTLFSFSFGELVFCSTTTTNY